MYCVQCGVRLKDGADRCPLCGLPAWKPEGIEGPEAKIPTFPNRLPKETHSRRKQLAVILSGILAIAALVVLIVYLAVGSGRPWGGIVLLGIAFSWVVLVFPLMLPKLLIELWVPLVHAACAGYVLFICRVTGGHWFLSFAFPVIGIHGILLLTMGLLLKYIKGNRCFILGGMTLAYGGYSILIEFFLHITFHTPMFRWSIFSAAALEAIGALLIVAGIIQPFKNYLHKNLFF